jgi:hypothetical protein
VNKRRYQVSPYGYEIAGFAGNYYIILDGNGNTTTLPRWQIIPCQAGRRDVRLGYDLPEHTGIIEAILDYDPRGKGKYLVEWATPLEGVDGELTSWVTKAEIEKQRTDPNQPSPIERLYWWGTPAEPTFSDFWKTPHWLAKKGTFTDT